MRTEQEIKEALEEQRRRIERGVVTTSREGLLAWAEALEWVLEGEIEDYIDNSWWDDLIEKAKNSSPVSKEELLQRMKEALERPVPFFRYLKEKEKARENGR
jgi:hypothetical protein